MKKQLLLAVLITATYAVAAQICQDNPTFTEKTSISTTADGAVSVYAADVDGDGDVDVLSASNVDEKIAWYESTCVNCTPPVISDEPDAITACAGSATSFTVAASGSGTLSYQWQEDGVPLSNVGVYSNATTATLNISNTTGLNGKKFKVIITNDNGTPNNANDDCSTTSEEVTLTVNEINPGEIGSSQTVCITKDPVAFTSVTAATGGGTITYQWEMSTSDCDTGFTPIDDATAATFDTAKGQFKGTTYFRRRAISTINGVACDAVSNCITLTVQNVDCGKFPWNGNE